jgi:hypothetical protein
MSENKAPDDPERTVQRLLGSMSSDRPRPSAKQATLAALGLGAAATSAAGAAGAAGGIAGLTKVLALGALAGVVTSGAIVGARHVLSQAATESALSVLSSASRDAVVPGTPPGTRRPDLSFDAQSNGDAHPTSVPAPPAPRVSRSGTSGLREVTRDRIDAPSGPATPPHTTGFEGRPPDSSLREETRQLDRARAAVAKGNARAALAELDRYDAAFRHGALAPEATLLRVRALLAAGDRAGAQALARSFAAAHPESSHLDQLRSLLAP